MALNISARRMKVAYFVFLGFLVLLLGVAIVRAEIPALVATVAVLIVASVSGYTFRNERWIDLAVWAPWGILAWGMKRSEAQAIEDMVAERMARLARLKEDR